MKKIYQKGFTLVELLIVISIVGLMSSIVLTPLNTATSMARDAQRKAHLDQVRIGLQLYHNKYGTYQVSGGGSGGGGQGWLGYEGGGYPKSVARVLSEEGFLNTPDIEDIQQDPGYMIYVCNGGNEFSLSATLENPEPADISKIQTTCNGVGANGTYTRYGKNYAISSS